eukprot:PhM_4_TR2485/c1_g5_i6/m.33999
MSQQHEDDIEDIGGSPLPVPPQQEEGEPHEQQEPLSIIKPTAVFKPSMFAALSHFQCELLLHRMMFDVSNNNNNNDNNQQLQTSPTRPSLAREQTKRGYDFEERVMASFCKDHRNEAVLDLTPWAQEGACCFVADFLASAKILVGTNNSISFSHSSSSPPFIWNDLSKPLYVFQAPLRPDKSVSEAIFGRAATDGHVKLCTRCFVDVVRMEAREVDNNNTKKKRITIRLTIIDMKASASKKLSHELQVAAYGVIIDKLLSSRNQDNNNNNNDITFELNTSTAEIWLPTNNNKSNNVVVEEAFDLRQAMSQAKRLFLGTVFQRSAVDHDNPPPVRLRSACEHCDYYHMCSNQRRGRAGAPKSSPAVSPPFSSGLTLELPIPNDITHIVAVSVVVHPGRQQCFVVAYDVRIIKLHGDNNINQAAMTESFGDYSETDDLSEAFGNVLLSHITHSPATTEKNSHAIVCCCDAAMVATVNDVIASLLARESEDDEANKKYGALLPLLVGSTRILSTTTNRVVNVFGSGTAKKTKMDDDGDDDAHAKTKNGPVIKPSTRSPPLASLLTAATDVYPSLIDAIDGEAFCTLSQMFSALCPEDVKRFVTFDPTTSLFDCYDRLPPTTATKTYLSPCAELNECMLRILMKFFYVKNESSTNNNKLVQRAADLNPTNSVCDVSFPRSLAFIANLSQLEVMVALKKARQERMATVTAAGTGGVMGVVLTLSTATYSSPSAASVITRWSDLPLVFNIITGSPSSLSLDEDLDRRQGVPPKSCKKCGRALEYTRRVKSDFRVVCRCTACQRQTKPWETLLSSPALLGKWYLVKEGATAPVDDDLLNSVPFTALRALENPGDVFLVDVVRVLPRTSQVGLYIHNWHALAPGTKYRLFARVTDFAFPRVMEVVMRGVGGKKHNPVMLGLLSDPNAVGLSGRHNSWSDAPLPSTTTTLHASQQAALQSFWSRGFQVLWGPPGTGKTHYLSEAIAAVVRHHLSTGDGVRVLICCTTHAAIKNLLVAVAARLDAQKSTGAFEIVMAHAGSTDSGTQTSIAFEDDARKIKSIMAATRCVVVGATPQRVHKVFMATASGPTFNLVVMDEATQMPTSQLIFPLSVVDPTNWGVIVAGDFLQLPPITNMPPVVIGNTPMAHLSSSAMHAMLQNDKKVFLPLDASQAISAVVMQGNNALWPSLSILSETHRCNQQITALTRALYGESYTALTDRHIGGLPSLVAVHIDGTGYKDDNDEVASCSNSSAAASTSVLYYRECVAPVAVGLVRRIKSEWQETGVLSIGIVTPLRVMRDAVVAAVVESDVEKDIEVVIDTVERMQGWEFDAIHPPGMCMPSERSGGQ